MKALAFIFASIWATVSFAQDPNTAATRARSAATPRAQTRLICKTGPEKRAPGQDLKLYFQYSLPYQFEPEDPTDPFGRQSLTLRGRPVMQLNFEKAPVSAGARGENLEPMQCAYARRPLSPKDPSSVRILMPPNEVAWLSQVVGQKPSTPSDRPVLVPGQDFAFASQYEKVFTVDLDDPRDFVTAQKPRPL